MGAFQGLQLKLLRKAYSQRRAISRGVPLLELKGVPCTGTVVKLHYRAMEGVVEGSITACVSMFLLITSNEFIGFALRPWQEAVLCWSSLFGLCVSALALAELDIRTSNAVHDIMKHSPWARLCHVVFRLLELCARLVTSVMFLLLTYPLAHGLWWIIPAAGAALDYTLGVAILIFVGGHDPRRQASFFLGLPLLISNVVQFADASGLSLQAQRVSTAVSLLRAAELLTVVAAVSVSPVVVHAAEDLQLRDFLLKHKSGWVGVWVLSTLCYYLLLAAYACRIRPAVDLHGAAAQGNNRNLEELLLLHQGDVQQQSTFDLDRCGPDGRTALHLAAVNGHTPCIRLLVEARAELDARTSGKLRSTALHLAAAASSPKVVRCLKQLAGSDMDIIDAVNADGETALHIAARRHSVEAVKELLREPAADAHRRNGRGETAADCCTAGGAAGFSFTRQQPEYIVQELLQRAEDGHLPPPAPCTVTSDVAASLGAAEASSTGAAGVVIQSMKATGAVDAGGGQTHNVPLLAVSLSTERRILQCTQSAATVVLTAPASRGYGLSSFVLSAGLGALSSALMAPLHAAADAVPDVAAHSSGLSLVSLVEPEPRPGSVTLEDFVEVRRLGEGSFAKVNLVQHRATGELLAMKLMDKAKFEAQRIEGKVHSEQFLLKTTRHPFIVSLHFAFQGATFWALVMEYCPNGDLQRQLNSRGAPGLPQAEVAHLMGQVLLALEHLHERNVIFRDLKPENVVLDANHCAKVTDFGLAKKLGSAADARTVCGSYGYVAPEILAKSKATYTFAVDLYSFGVMLYVLLSGGERSHGRQQRLPPARHADLRRRLRTAERHHQQRSQQMQQAWSQQAGTASTALASAVEAAAGTRPATSAATAAAAANMDWARPGLEALPLVKMLTSEDPLVRKTAAEVKTHGFFTRLLGRPVDALLTDVPAYTSATASLPFRGSKQCSSIVD